MNSPLARRLLPPWRGGLRIAQVTPLYEAVPPRLYGGTERIVAHLSNALVEHGHAVTLFASAEANTRAELVPVRDQAIRLDPDPLTCDLAAHLAMLHEVRRRAREFDIIHFHTDLLHFPFFESMPEATLTTLHGRLDMKDLAAAYTRWPRFPLVSISDRQRRPLTGANWIATVHHGLPPTLYRYAPGAERGYLAFLGRVAPEKRVDRAIRVARRAGLPLKIAAKVDNADRAYFSTVVEPMLADPGVEFVGEIGDADKSAFFAGAVALLFPIDWPEPFGLVMIEAMACGVPVVAWNCGAVPEVVEHGTTGYIVGSEDEAVAALGRIHCLDRLRIRREFERRFSADVMAERYVGLYRRLVGSDPSGKTLRETA